MTDFLEFLDPDHFERMLWLIIFASFAALRYHRMIREERRKDRLMDLFLKHYGDDKSWPPGTHESLRVMLQKDSTTLVNLRKSPD